MGYSVILLSANLSFERRWITDSEDEALFITQSSTNTDISAEIEGNRV